MVSKRAIKVSKEALKVGALTAVLGLIVNGQVRARVQRSLELPLTLGLTGAGFHILAEALGLNRWYIMNGAANDALCSNDDYCVSRLSGCCDVGAVMDLMAKTPSLIGSPQQI